MTFAGRRRRVAHGGALPSKEASCATDPARCTAKIPGLLRIRGPATKRAGGTLPRDRVKSRDSCAGTTTAENGIAENGTHTGNGISATVLSVRHAQLGNGDDDDNDGDYELRNKRK